MKRCWGDCLIGVGAQSCFSAGFAQQVELNLKLWHPGVVGADEWVADYGTYDFEVLSFAEYRFFSGNPPRHIRTRTS